MLTASRLYLVTCGHDLDRRSSSFTDDDEELFDYRTYPPRRHVNLERACWRSKLLEQKYKDCAAHLVTIFHLELKDEMNKEKKQALETRCEDLQKQLDDKQEECEKLKTHQNDNHLLKDLAELLKNGLESSRIKCTNQRRIIGGLNSRIDDLLQQAELLKNALESSGIKCTNQRRIIGGLYSGIDDLLQQ
ncbi:Hypothetical predicted protein, partial [Paramuricea clavata]